MISMGIKSRQSLASRVFVSPWYEKLCCEMYGTASVYLLAIASAQQAAFHY